MEAAHPAQPAPSLAATLQQRRVDLHAQCVRSAAMTNPRLIADLIRRWLREDAA